MMKQKAIRRILFIFIGIPRFASNLGRVSCIIRSRERLGIVINVQFSIQGKEFGSRIEK
jgi:hypothetical protein